jgi:predicted Zn finger-like uncharacterized protein
VIITCPGCKTRYRVDAKALTTPGGRTVRCAACGLSWHHQPAALEIGPIEKAKAEASPLEPTLAPPTHPEPPHPMPTPHAPAGARPWASLLAAEATGREGPPQMPPAETRPHRRRWLVVGLLMFAVLIILLAALYLFRP